MSWIQTYTGRRFDFNDVTAGDICIEDIARALANICRFNGHTLRFYSVAEHSYWVSRMGHPVDELGNLLHDAEEAYLGDVVKPLKPIICENGFETVRERINAAIAKRFDLPVGFQARAKVPDLRMLATEREQVMGESPHAWEVTSGVKSYPIQLEQWSPDKAYEMFMTRYRSIVGKAGYRNREIVAGGVVR